MAIIKNVAECIIIIPGLAVDEGLIVPEQAIEVPNEYLESDFVQGCIERGELEVIEQAEEPKRRRGSKVED